MLLFLFLTTALILSSWHMPGDYVNYQFAIGLVFCSIPIAIYFSKRMGLLFGSFISYYLVSSLSTFLYFYGRNGALPAGFQNQVSIECGISLLLSLVIFLGCFFCENKELLKLRNAFAAVTVFNALYVIHSEIVGFKLPGGRGATGLLDYCGMNGTAIALGCAFLYPKKNDSEVMICLKVAGIVISFLAIAFSRTCIPLGVFALVIGSRISLETGRLKPVLVTSVLCLTLAFATLGKKVVNSSHRFEAYRMYVNFIKDEKRILFGTGLGTLKVWAPTIQDRAGFQRIETGGFYLWDKCHSEFIQSFVELGLVGLLFVISIYLTCLYRLFLKLDYELLSMGIALGGASAINYPLRYFYTALLVSFFVVSSLRCETSKTAS